MIRWNRHSILLGLLLCKNAPACVCLLLIAPPPPLLKPDLRLCVWGMSRHPTRRTQKLRYSAEHLSLKQNSIASAMGAVVATAALTHLHIT